MDVPFNLDGDEPSDLVLLSLRENLLNLFCLLSELIPVDHDLSSKSDSTPIFELIESGFEEVPLGLPKCL